MEREINGLSAKKRLDVRRGRSAPLVGRLKVLAGRASRQALARRRYRKGNGLSPQALGPLWTTSAAQSLQQPLWLIELLTDSELNAPGIPI